MVLAVGFVPVVHAEMFCGAVVKGGQASGKTEAEAKSAATAWWASRAGALGEGYQSWERAKDKTVDCRPGPSETFKCIASGKPCLPEGKLPDAPNKRDL